MAFIEWELPQIKGRRKRMASNEVNLYKTNTYNTMTFNQDLTKLFLEKDLLYLEIRQDDITGEIGFAISKDKGVRLSETGTGGNTNLRLPNKEWVERLHKVLGKPIGQRNILRLSENLSRKEDVLFYKIIG